MDATQFKKKKKRNDFRCHFLPLHYSLFNSILFSCFENKHHGIDSQISENEKHKRDFYNVVLVHLSSKSKQLVIKNIRYLHMQLLMTHLTST